MKYFLSAVILVLVLVRCDQVPLAYRLQYSYTSEERDSMEVRVYDEARRMYRGSLLKQAKLDTLIALNPEVEEYYRIKSTKYYRTGMLDEGYALMEKAVQLDPLNALYYTSAQLLFFYRDYERALDQLSYYDDITEGVTHASGENVNYLKGLAYKQLGMYDQAVEEFNKYVYDEGESASVYAYVYRGIANLRHECLDDAEEDFLLAVEKYENCTMGYVYLGETYIRMGRNEEAMAALVEAESLLCRGTKHTNPYHEVFDEVYLDQIYDLLSRCQRVL